MQIPLKAERSKCIFWNSSITFKAVPHGAKTGSAQESPYYSC
jgi:hypothetical protein